MDDNKQQLELFSDSSTSSPDAGPGGKFKFFIQFRGYEKIILGVIGLIITAVAFFSLGVEKGKRDSTEGTAGYRARPAEAAQATPTQPAKLTAAAAEPKDKTAPQDKTTTVKAQYTIQLASYQNGTAAQKEADQLKKSGWQAAVITRGSYATLCVGGFSSKEDARQQLNELRKKYRDSFIRRL